MSDRTDIISVTDEGAIKRKFIESLERQRGNRTLACMECGITRKQVKAWLVTDSVFRADYIDAMEGVDDFVESKLMELIDGIAVITPRGIVYKQSPHLGAVIKYLEAKMAYRGYTQKVKEPASQTPHQNIAAGIPVQQAGDGNPIIMLTEDEKKRRLDSLTVEELRVLKKASALIKIGRIDDGK